MLFSEWLFYCIVFSFFVLVMELWQWFRGPKKVTQSINNQKAVDKQKKYHQQLPFPIPIITIEGKKYKDWLYYVNYL